MINFTVYVGLRILKLDLFWNSELIIKRLLIELFWIYVGITGFFAFLFAGYFQKTLSNL